MPENDLELLHNFIHDLKSPLSSTKSFVDLIIASGDLNKDQKRFAHRALSNIDRMHGIISTLLEYARMEARDEIDIEIVDLLDITEDVVRILEGSAKEHQITIHYDIQDDSQFVQADEILLQSVIMNLVSNAIKYNRIGGDIFISSEDAGEFVRILIRDTGLGIPENALPHIFDRFYRVPNKEHMIIEGTGIGLAMVKGVIEKHGGEISVTSVLDEGSTFDFTIKRASTASPDYDREPTDGLDDRFQEARLNLDDTDSGELPRKR